MPRRRLVSLILAIGAVSCSGRSGDVRAVDEFEKAGPWAAGASEGGVAVAATVAGAKGRGLRLAYDFQQGAGYAFIRRAIDLDLSGNFELSLRLRGEAPKSTVEVKFVDESGDNVWWRQYRAKEFASEWETVRIRRSDIAFAWGPTPDRALGKIASIEFVVVGAAKEKGAVDFDSLAIRRLPEPPAAPPALVASANAQDARAPASAAVDGDPETAWRTAPRRESPAILTLDLGYLRDFGGLTLDWAENGAPAKVEASYSEDKRNWSPMRALDRDGSATYIRAEEAFGRFVRLRMTPAKEAPIGLAEAKIEKKAFGADDTAFLQTLAARSPRGAFPRSLSGEQTYWTIVGAPEGGKTALLSEDGAVEPGPGAFSIEPFMIVDGAVKSWADGAHAHWLTDNYLPLPYVRRTGDDYALDVSVHSSPGKGGDRAIVARYRVVNTSPKRRKFTLALAVRPFQVNPPTQVLNIAGGASAITRAEWNGAALSVNDDWRLYPTRTPASLSLAASIAAGGIAVSGDDAGAPREVDAPDGFGSAASYFDFDLAPGAGDEIAIIALQGPPDAAPAGITASAVARSEEAAAAEWRAALGRTQIDGPFEASAILDSVKTALAHVLLTRDGAALRPGARSYARTWIRDGAMISESLLRLGHAETATDFARWFAPFQFESGKVPCCADARGADPVPENDSHGELIFLAAEIYRYTKDKTFTEEMWPHVDDAAEAINALRRSEMKAPREGKERAPTYGLLPPSISHEGYMDKPAYSYWDDFWGLQGLRDGAFLAGELGRLDRAEALRQDADEFSADISASLEKSGLDFIPGAADRRDFDATSTTVAFAPTGVASSLPSDALSETFERAWRSFTERRDSGKAWDAYTPYEFRQVSAFLRLDRADRAHELFDFYLHDRRPSGWNQWAEVVGRNAREPRFIGDIPHTWVASDFIRAALDLFAYEDRDSGSLVIAAGVKPEWLKGAGITVRNLQTPYGPLSYSASERDGKIVISLAGEAAPPGGFRIPTVFLGGEFNVTINKRGADLSDGAVVVESAPAEIVLSPRESDVAPSAQPHSLARTPGQHAVEIADAAGRTHRLFLYLPDTAAKAGNREKFPLLLFLHGSGERGDDISKVKIHGPPKLVDQGRDFPFIVASPQLPNGAHWEPEALTGLLEALIDETPADPDRIYVTGLSLGGHGTWALAAAEPDRIAAIAPISGAGAPKTAAALKDMPVWSFHGALDDIVPPGQDISMVEAVNSSGGAARLTLYPDLGHDAWTRTYDNPELYDWLLTHRRRGAAE